MKAYLKHLCLLWLCFFFLKKSRIPITILKINRKKKEAAINIKFTNEGTFSLAGIEI